MDWINQIPDVSECPDGCAPLEYDLMYGFSPHVLTGRRRITTSLLPEEYVENNFGAVVLNEETLKADLARVLPIHKKNSMECEYLLKYYKGDQPILYRVEEERSGDERKVVNFAQAISRNMSSYTYSGGIQYLASDPRFFDAVKVINSFMKRENKSTISKEVQDYQSICGTAYMAILPDTIEKNDVPFELRFLSPVNTFVVYSSFNPNVPIYGCVSYQICKNKKTRWVYQVYTINEIYTFEGASFASRKLTAVREKVDHPMGGVPIIEYPNNAFRLGDFEVALSLLDAINELTSDCLYNIKSVVTSYLCIFGVDKENINPEEMNKNRIMVFSGQNGINQDAKFVYTQLDGTSTQFLRSYLESALKLIVGMPDRDAGQTGSDTGVAAELRTGQGDQETVAKTKALYAVMSERRLLDIAIRLLAPEYITGDIKSSDIDIEINRINRADILTKTQAMNNLYSMGFPEEDIVAFANITNDVVGVSNRWKDKIAKEKEEEANSEEMLSEQRDISTEQIVVEEV